MRSIFKSSRKDSKEETRSFALQSGNKEDTKLGIRIFRRDNSREDVGRDSANPSSIAGPVSSKGKQACREEKQERTEERVGVSSTSKSKPTVHEQSKTKVLTRESQESLDERSSRDEEASVEQNDRVSKKGTMLDVVVVDEKLLEDQEGVKRGEKEGREKVSTEGKNEDSMVEEKEVSENENLDSMKEAAESLLDISETDASAFGANERRSADLGHGRKSDEVQVVSIFKFVSNLFGKLKGRISFYLQLKGLH